MTKSDAYFVTIVNCQSILFIVYIFKVTGRFIKLAIERTILEKQVTLSATHTSEPSVDFTTGGHDTCSCISHFNVRAFTKNMRDKFCEW